MLCRAAGKISLHINERGVKIMAHKSAKIIKGVGIGMAVGGAVGLVGSAVARQPHYQRNLKKGFNKAMKTVGNVLETIG